MYTLTLHSPLSIHPFLPVLLCYRDLLLKPLIKERNFLKEVQFYEYVSSLGSHSSQSPAAFLPKYYGVLNFHDRDQDYNPPDTDTRREKRDNAITMHNSRSDVDISYVKATTSSFYVVLENVTKQFRKPCVLDLKIGRQVTKFIDKQFTILFYYPSFILRY